MWGLPDLLLRAAESEGGPAEVGLAEGGNGGDAAITKPVRLGGKRTAPPWTDAALHGEGLGAGLVSPRGPPPLLRALRHVDPSVKAGDPS